WPNATGRMTPMLSQTFGTTNSGPRVGPIVISEVMYAPEVPGIGTDIGDLEFVEILNPTAASQDLTDWRLARAIDYAFPQGTMIGVDERIVVVSFDPDLPENAQRLSIFRGHYFIDDSVRIIGGYFGRLDNAGDRLELLRPDSPPANEPGFTPLLLEDEVRYEIASPWPTGANVTGLSITRLGSVAWGNDGANWAAALPTPGDLYKSFMVASARLNQTMSDPADLAKGPQPTSWRDQRSQLSDVVLTFSQITQLTVDDLVLTNLGIEADVDNDVVIALTSDQLNFDRNVLTISLLDTGLTQGVYQLEISNTITDVLGRRIDGNGDGIGGDTYLLQGDSNNHFYQLTAEYNGDKGVSVFDFTTFSYWFGNSVGIAPAYADNNGDDGVSVFDFTAFSTNFGAAVKFPTGLQIAVSAAFSPEQMRDDGDEAVFQEVQRVEQVRWNIVPPQKIEVAFLERRETELDDLLKALANDVARVWDV
ncbi:MAG: hypothetical protein ACI9HK_005569, partial [Pirellulaceae bacterium]